MTRIDVDLPKLKFTLPDWEKAPLREIAQAEQRLRHFTFGSGKGSSRFMTARVRLKRALEAGKDMQQAVRDRMDVRAYTDLILNDEEFGTEAPLDGPVLHRLVTASGGKLGNLAFLDLMRLLFDFRDDLEDRPALERFLAGQLRERTVRDPQSVFGRMQHHAKHLFREDGPHRVAKFAIKRGVLPEDALTGVGLGDYGNGQFASACRSFYYLERLRQLSPNMDDPLLRELKKEQAYEAPLGEGRRVGHSAIEIICEKCAGRAISDLWLSVIMRIAGDPRVPPQSPRYQKWWTQIDAKNRTQVQAWLSKVDLELFLDLLEQHARASSSDALRRMFPARKRFLQGLYEQGLVTDSRLFLSKSAHEMVERRYEPKDRPVYARSTDRHKSVIYFGLTKGYLIEGTHNFKVVVTDQLPKTSDILNYGRQSYDPWEFGAGFERKYQQEYGTVRIRSGDVLPVRVMHTPPLGWQYKTIRALEAIGLRVHREPLFTAQDYRRFRTRYV